VKSPAFAAAAKYRRACRYVVSLIVRRKVRAKVAHCTKQWPALQKPLILTLD
jgi:hypothetical protein